MNLTPLGAFYEGGRLPYDESAPIVDQTPRLFNGSIAVQANELASLDTNSDGTVNTSDTVFANLKVWEDANEDGILDSGEMKSLADAGISSIPLNGSDIVYASGNAKTIETQDVAASEDPLQAVDPTASTPTIDYDYYRNTIDPARASDGHVWSSSEVKFTDDNQYAIGTSGADSISADTAPLTPSILGGDGSDLLQSGWHNSEIWGDAGNDSILGADIVEVLVVAS